MNALGGFPSSCHSSLRALLMHCTAPPTHGSICALVEWLPFISLAVYRTRTLPIFFAYFKTSVLRIPASAAPTSALPAFTLTPLLNFWILSFHFLYHLD